ncbi:hypothetical protein E1A91_A13G236600v1 [Gossypium mustelinum]|uniref:Uncharacterized protein n=1 Tax=Gossypium mustelinum TaxID=34275 RepID=A0A5D2WLK5_GOSMU|nr:hypothetical protein E1A91_A13G236600v1 [Gossypium mustelinum]TYJ02544.1 hypothetical protein E1A91_A13G236600v1 [Gossypium mustelinum]
MAVRRKRPFVVTWRLASSLLYIGRCQRGKINYFDQELQSWNVKLYLVIAACFVPCGC